MIHWSIGKTRMTTVLLSIAQKNDIKEYFE
jgi:hypothetical protein